MPPIFKTLFCKYVQQEEIISIYWYMFIPSLPFTLIFNNPDWMKNFLGIDFHVLRELRCQNDITNDIHQMKFPFFYSD